MIDNERKRVERWGLFETELAGPEGGNPFKDVTLTARFCYKHRSVQADGFYDGGGRYVIRFMPDEVGDWTYTVSANVLELDGMTGSFRCVPASEGNRGPVRVRSADGFAYEDGAPYLPFGTTCYAWTHQGQELQDQTILSLAGSPFNKIRMCVFPKRYSFNTNEPERFPFVRSPEDGFDWSRPDPRYYAELERRIMQLQQLGIEADLILFHPYDKGHWGFDRMDAETDDSYLRYAVARLAAYRNVWWSVANEYDFMKTKTMADWDRYFRIVEECDPYAHLRSIHNGTRMYDPSSLVLYDHAKRWVTHISLQHWDVTSVTAYRAAYRKPVVVDECCYEGNLPQRWGNITGEEMTARFWEGFVRGGYVGHGETFLHPEDIVWWSKGGTLHGESPDRIGFLKRVLEEAPGDIRPLDTFREPTIGVEGRYYLQYTGIHRPAYRELALPDTAAFRVDVIDTWNMSVEPVDGLFSGPARIPLPGKPYIALRVYVVDDVEAVDAVEPE